MAPKNVWFLAALLGLVVVFSPSVLSEGEDVKTEAGKFVLFGLFVVTCVLIIIGI